MTSYSHCLKRKIQGYEKRNGGSRNKGTAKKPLKQHSNAKSYRMMLRVTELQDEDEPRRLERVTIGGHSRVVQSTLQLRRLTNDTITTRTGTSHTAAAEIHSAQSKEHRAVHDVSLGSQEWQSEAENRQQHHKCNRWVLRIPVPTMAHQGPSWRNGTEMTIKKDKPI